MGLEYDYNPLSDHSSAFSHGDLESEGVVTPPEQSMDVENPDDADLLSSVGTNSTETAGEFVALLNSRLDEYLPAYENTSTIDSESVAQYSQALLSNIQAQTNMASSNRAPNLTFRGSHLPLSSTLIANEASDATPIYSSMIEPLNASRALDEVPPVMESGPLESLM